MDYCQIGVYLLNVVRRQAILDSIVLVVEKREVLQRVFRRQSSLQLDDAPMFISAEAFAENVEGFLHFVAEEQLALGHDLEHDPDVQHGLLVDDEPHRCIAETAAQFLVDALRRC